MPQIKIKISPTKTVEIEAIYNSLEDALKDVENFENLIKKLYEHNLVPKYQPETETMLTRELETEDELKGIIEYDENGFPHLMLGKGEVTTKDAILIVLYAAKKKNIPALEIKEINEAIPWRIPYSTLSSTISKLKSKGYLIHKPVGDKTGYTITKKGIDYILPRIKELSEER